MGILAALHHVTDYRYDRLVKLDPQIIRLRPAPHARPRIQSYSLKIVPQDHFINWQQDPFGNYLARLVFPKRTRHFCVEVDLVTEIHVFNPFDFFLDESAQEFPFTYEKDLQEELAPYLELKEDGKLLQQLRESVDLRKQSTIDFLVGINKKLNTLLTYVIRLEHGIQTCEETLNSQRGSCRDMAWLLCQLLRHLGLASRFVSGYLIQLKADVKSLDGPTGPDQDFTDLHAWTEVYLPGAGWVGLDPTSGLIAGEGHIPLCCTPNPTSAAPITGSLEACESKMIHEMAVTRIHEDRRTTRPYTEDEWCEIDAIGRQVDKNLEKLDVRLTMGGEPTFVSADDRTSDEWHFTALGKNKKKLGTDLLLRLKNRFGSGGLLHFSQGKWYPGEILPRWAMRCYWRKDLEPLWQEPGLLTDPNKDNGHNLNTAKEFLTNLSQSLGIPSSYILPAREDTPYYLWKEHRLPNEGDLFKTDVYEKTERKRLQTLLDKNLNKPVGYVLPLHFSYKRGQWISNAWRFRGKHLVLAIGDSPIGLRLPLNSLPVVPDANEEFFPERSAYEQLDPLPTRKSLFGLLKKRSSNTAKKPSFANDPNGLIRSALCAEIRNGTLHLFLPPITYAEHFIDLIAAIEFVAKSLNTPIVLEGYAPPNDLRLQHFSVTPDPGVLEVNVHPASTWDELKGITFPVYEEARLARLSTEKFLLDGRLVGTGGGNHIIVGAQTPADSPFLRRPDLLRSLVTFWQNHPSLSYLFSSQYIGPTSQAPRIDEARHDSLYELEIAFRQIPEKKEVSPWLVDRIFRNLLVDLTGNTHRAEFCIDKLYSPESNSGRLGLLEMRGFEMTPHPQMNLLQSLLIRSFIAHFWKTPYLHKLIAWGTRLHDEFMLPHYVWEDFCEVLHGLDAGGYHFKSHLFEPFADFRFPLYGKVQVGPIMLELRMALEPWPVMGEELHQGAVSRSVDSSVERLQAKATGVIEGRHIIACNGHALPLRPTREKGVSVAGVRYKAWAPHSSLHPTIPIHTPLVFDVLDTYSKRSLGGCTYHVMHPGGRNYEEIPVNNNEAEGRRLSRFQPMGHTPGKCAIPVAENNPDFPYTLDLRIAR